MVNETKISLCMIARNEEQWIGQCLESVQDLVDEIILVDTGSKDKTIEIAQSKGAIIHHLEWPNDFSKARNYSLEQASGDWILVLDADEVIAKEDHEKIRKLVNSNEADAYYLVQTTYDNSPYKLGWKTNSLSAREASGHPGFTESPLARLFRNGRGIRYTGIIHEHPKIDTQPILSDLRVHHYGMLNADPEAFQRKQQLYLHLARTKCSQDPTNAQAWYELGVTYDSLELIDEALAVLSKGEGLAPDYVRIPLAMASIALRMGQSQLAKTSLLKALRLDHTEVLPYIHLPLLLAMDGEFNTAEKLMIAGDLSASLHPVYCLNAGKVLRMMGNYRRSLNYFKQAFRLGLEDGAPQLESGLSLMELGEFSQARTAFQTASRSNYFRIRLAAVKKLAECGGSQDEMDLSLLKVNQALEEFPDDWELWHAKAYLLVSQGRLEEVRECLREIRREDIQQNSNAIFNLMQLNLAVGNDTEAAQLKKLLYGDVRHEANDERGRI